uniref:Uncharacterized protein n=1 Tax=Syphacia muris TaxID=451379 RepID=A0A0N5AGK5_9BILA
MPLKFQLLEHVLLKVHVSERNLLIDVVDEVFLNCLLFTIFFSPFLISLPIFTVLKQQRMQNYDDGRRALKSSFPTTEVNANIVMSADCSLSEVLQRNDRRCARNDRYHPISRKRMILIAERLN